MRTEADQNLLQAIFDEMQALKKAVAIKDERSFYIEHTIKNEIFRSYPGWAVWHSCFDTVHRQNKIIMNSA